MLPVPENVLHSKLTIDGLDGVPLGDVPVLTLYTKLEQQGCGNFLLTRQSGAQAAECASLGSIRLVRGADSLTTKDVDSPASVHDIIEDTEVDVFCFIRLKYIDVVDVLEVQVVIVVHQRQGPTIIIDLIKHGLYVLFEVVKEVVEGLRDSGQGQLPVAPGLRHYHIVVVTRPEEHHVLDNLNQVDVPVGNRQVILQTLGTPAHAVLSQS